MGTDGAAGFQIKPWEVHGEGREFENISNDFARAALALEQGLAGLGTPWGNDEPGSGFGSAYGEAQPGILAGLHGLAGRLGGIGAGLHTMADQSSGADDDVRTTFAGQGGAAGTGPAPVTV
jgi:hypothetical protein